MYGVLGLLVVLLIIYFYTEKPTMAPKKKEGFSDTYAVPPAHDVKMPTNIPPPPPAMRTSPIGATLPGKLPAAPYQQVARNSPLPYQDPALIKTTRQRILNTLEDLKGFLAFQSNEIEYRSDPSIQLPLTTARADFQRLSDEANVLQRNPGLQPDMTEKEMDEIRSNLAYLQREVGLIGANRPFQNTGQQNLEGFQNENGGDVEPSQLASEDDLQQFSAKIQGEIMRLSASGTTDPIVNARITNLTAMKNEVDGIITKLQSGALLSTEVPIHAIDIQNALPVLADPSQPLPQILQSISLPSGLSNMLPANVTNDPNIVRQTNNIIQKYAKDFFEGVSASVAVKVDYVSPREQDIAKSRAVPPTSQVNKTGFPSLTDLNSITTGHELSAPATITDTYAADPRAENRTPAHFNWKARAKHIEDQIRLRGYKHEDFGVMPQVANVSSTFSWKGYARMLCTRLQNTMDTGLPEACGCPPADWKGW